MQICQIPLTLQVDLLFLDDGRLDLAEESTRFFSMSSLLLCLTNPIHADLLSSATPVTKDRLSLAIGLIPVLPHLQSFALNKRHVDVAK